MSKNLTALSFEGESGLKYHRLAIGIIYGASNKGTNCYLYYYDFNSAPYFNTNSQITLDQFREFLYEKYNHNKNGQGSIIGFSSSNVIFSIIYNNTNITISVGDADSEAISKITVSASASY